MESQTIAVTVSRLISKIKHDELGMTWFQKQSWSDCDGSSFGGCVCKRNGMLQRLQRSSRRSANVSVRSLSTKRQERTNSESKLKLLVERSWKQNG